MWANRLLFLLSDIHSSIHLFMQPTYIYGALAVCQALCEAALPLLDLKV